MSATYSNTFPCSRKFVCCDCRNYGRLKGTRLNKKYKYFRSVKQDSLFPTGTSKVCFVVVYNKYASAMPLREMFIFVEIGISRVKQHLI